LDFDDLIMKLVELLQTDEEALAKWRDRFRHVLVDEYQDTNRAQYVLVNLLAAEHRNVVVVGDDDQSIYRFRGADVRNILDFRKDYPDAHVVRLEQNYRSSQAILDAAYSVIRRNPERAEKRLVGGVRFWERREVKDLVAYLRFTFNPRDALSFGRIVSVPPRKIGSVTVDAIGSYARTTEIDILSLLADPARVPGLPKA